MIRRLVFILFLYILLAWIVAYLLVPANFVQPAMLSSAVGVGTLLLGLIAERIMAGWRGHRANQPPKPVAAVATPAQPARSEEESALASLLQEADQRLAEAPGTPGSPPQRFTQLPMYLVLGPTGAGKTALMQSSGIEPVLLAGQALTASGSIGSTRTANIWMAGQSVFTEIAGRIFDGDLAPLKQLVKVLRGQGSVSRWRHWLSPPRPPADLRGALLVCDASWFKDEPEASKLDRSAKQIRDRLYGIAQALGADLPVYLLFTRADTLQFFPEFFARMSEAELKQIFGVLSPAAPPAVSADRVWAEAETKRLNRQFQELILRLDDRRLVALTQEPEARRKPAIYEFPREFKKIRNHLVQFVVDVFKPDPLSVGPRLAGFFFTGTLAGERTGTGPLPTMLGNAAWSDATQVFQGDVTMLQKRAALPMSNPAERRVFVFDLFQNVILRHRPVASRRAAPLSGFEEQRRLAAVVACGLAFLLAIVWTVSWLENRGLTGRMEQVIAEVRGKPADVSLAGLNALEGLRLELETLDSSDRMRQHWGLYTGGKLRQIGRVAYFERLKRAALERLDVVLGSQLRSTGPDSPAQSPDLVYDRLKTYRTISGSCDVDPPLALRVLRATAAQAYPNLGGEETVLLSRQLEYYTNRLRPLPIKLDENAAAEEGARAYLRQAGGLEQQFRGLIAAVEGKAARLTVAGTVDYQDLMNGPTDISGAFTPKGMDLFEDLVAKGNLEAGKDSCVMGDAGGAGQTSGKDELKSRFYREYAGRWREFLASCKIRPFNPSLDDSARRLGNLADAGKSPLLGIVRFISANSNVAPPKADGSGFVETAKKTFGYKDPTQSKTVKAAEAVLQLSSSAVLLTRTDLQTMLEPVLFTIPPPFDHPVNPNDEAYVKALRELGDASSGLSRAANTPEKPAALQKALEAVAKAREARSGMVDRFPDSPNGLRDPLAELLIQPIQFAEAIIRQNSDVSGAPKKNDDLAKLCRDLRPILAKYPFNPRDEGKGATADDLKKAFAPNNGLIPKYVQQSAVDFLVHQGQEWQEKPNPGFSVTPELLNFVNSAQKLTSAFFASGGEPAVEYTLRPTEGQAIKIELALDGRKMEGVFQMRFRWPGEPAGAAGRVVSPASYGFGAFEGMWATFRLFQSADPRPLGPGKVVWSVVRGLGNAKPQPLDPPVRVDILNNSPATDVLNPTFFQGLHSCPARAVVVAN